MQHGIHTSVELLKVERQLLDRELRYHYLVVDQKLRRQRSIDGAGFLASVRSFFAPRTVLTEERGA